MKPAPLRPTPVPSAAMPSAAMRSARSAEQEQFAAALHDMLTDARAPGADREPGADGTLRAARRWAAGDRVPGLALWGRLAELGVTALAVPERYGGLGGSPLDLVIACEELGHHALPGPVAESLAAVPQLLTELLADRPGRASPGNAALDGEHPGAEGPGESDPGQRRPGSGQPRDGHPGDGHPGGGFVRDADACAQWLASLAAGDLIGTLARPPRLPYAADAEAAGLVLLVEADEVRLATPGARHQSVDATRSLFEVRGQQQLARGPAVTAAAGRALDLGALASAAQLLGAGRALLEASVRHAGQRVQFGRPIGAFQAVKHHLADAAIGLEFARPLLDAAAVTLADRSATATRDVSAAKVACADAAHRAARAALQVHGAIGYTQEHDLSLWLTKVRALISAWGSQAEHRAVVMAALTGASEPA